MFSRPLTKLSRTPKPAFAHPVTLLLTIFITSLSTITQLRVLHFCREGQDSRSQKAKLNYPDKLSARDLTKYTYKKGRYCSFFDDAQHPPIGCAPNLQIFDAVFLPDTFGCTRDRFPLGRECEGQKATRMSISDTLYTSSSIQYTRIRFKFSLILIACKSLLLPLCTIMSEVHYNAQMGGIAPVNRITG